MSLVFVDSNVLLYSEDSANAAKQQRAVDWLDALWTRRCGRLSTQVLSEFYTHATRGLQPAMPAGDARAEVRRYQRWQPWPIDPDALVLAAAQQQGCEWLLSEDLPHDRQIDGVRILNPFLVGPERLDATP